MMKFANIWYLSKNVANVGEGIISMSLERIYRKMGIPENEIVWINHVDVATYDGEECIFPIVSFLQNIESVGSYSTNIRPVFICYVSFAPFTQHEIAVLKQYEPIGCRDAYTLEQCRLNGIKAYLNGCITALLPKYYGIRNRQTVLSDVDPELLSFIPPDLLQNTVTVKHNDKVFSLKEYIARAKEFMDLFSHSSLCITSRLHCASPSMAVGTPVIFAKNNLSSRFSWIDRFLPIYEKTEYNIINWNQGIIDYEKFKPHVDELIITRLHNAYQDKTDNDNVVCALAEAVDSFYGERPPKEYPIAFDRFASALANRRKRTDSFNYAFWGYSPFHGSMHEYIEKNYPHSQLMHIYDDFRKDYAFAGLSARPITESIMHPEELVICFCSSQTSLDKMRTILEQQDRNKNNYIADFYQE
jgi:hypothetical protein